MLFAGYKVPHPLQYNILIKVQTNHDQPVTAFKTAVSDLIRACASLQEQLKVQQWKV